MFFVEIEIGCLAWFCSRSSGFRDRRAPDYTTRQTKMVAREGSAPPIAVCRPAVILFHRAEENWLPGLDSHQHGRLQRAVSYKLDDPATKWWAATVLPRVLRFRRPLHHSLMLAARKWSQSRVLPPAELAYETGLSAGSIASWSPHPELHRVDSPTERVHR